jgi:hypothetical protein
MLDDYSLFEKRKDLVPIDRLPIDLDIKFSLRSYRKWVRLVGFPSKKIKGKWWASLGLVRIWLLENA